MKVTSLHYSGKVKNECCHALMVRTERAL